MKKIVLLTIASAICWTSSVAQRSLASIEPANSVQLSPIFVQPSPSIGLAPGLRMRNTGRALTLAGSAMFIGGIVVFSQASTTYYSSTSSSYGNQEEGDPKAAIGILMITGGLGMAVPGIIFWTKGQKKYDRWLNEQREKQMSFGIQRSGIGLQYRF